MKTKSPMRLTLLSTTRCAPYGMLALNKQIPQHLKSPNSHPVSMPEDLKAEIESKAPVSETEIQNMRNLNLNLNSAQFFYLAPKFPQHLKFDKNMHIHFPYKVKRWPINQGMDEHNEKRVWELLVESAESHSAHRQCTMKNFWHANTWHVVIFFVVLAGFPLTNLKMVIVQ